MEPAALNRATFGSPSEFAETSVQTVEMQENSVTDPTPVLSRLTVITAQPRGDVSQARRPIPVNTLDWVSTPRSQLSALSGSHFLGNVEQLEIQQIVDLSTLLGRSEKKFQYRVKIPRAETLFLAMHARSDKPADWSCSRLLRDDITLNILDQCGETAFVMRMNSRRTIALNKLHTMIVGSSKMLGSVEENFCIMGSSFTVYDEARRPLSNIYGPNVCGCCMYQEAQFQVISIDGTHQIASLMHQWDNVLHDYNLLITFPANTDIKFKSLLLGAAFLLVNITSFVARCSKIAVINVTFSRCAFRSICTLKN
ncbi:phospholipid scramblase family member 5 isoform X3 [Ceratina calcarata]|uniref:Phospholipid scramblase n=2 Tax=Ceratina calcarata TaxID=156304 RepID=A0AAJ7SAJ5_9HYME|nr:phospholipid scramblase family member 5 isoform X3 [Ceratina calcarata]XP_026674538.1 phospholipid scramblase family member 5 isoform X3 [Ceratina calcarata]XP_026674539.1 phospholipid scramblase family member 5 isoform X3 [Ceratina calcarata]